MLKSIFILCLHTCLLVVSKGQGNKKGAIFDNTPPEYRFLRVGQDATLKCTVTIHENNQHVFWTKDDNEIKNYTSDGGLTNVKNEHSFFIDELNSLTIKNVQSQHTGRYACNVLTYEGYKHSTIVLKIIKEKSKIMRSPRSKSVRQGQDILFRCNVRGNPMPNITWVHKGLTVDPKRQGDLLSSRYVTTTKVSSMSLISATLKITDVRNEDEGEYTCHAQNNVGNDTASTNLKVMSRRIIIQGPASQDALKGSGVKLTCNVSIGSLNFVKVSWKKDNNDIELENQSRISIDASSHELRIQHAELHDSGLYTCIASTSNAGTDTESGKLTVLESYHNVESNTNDKPHLHGGTLDISNTTYSFATITMKRYENTDVVIDCKSKGSSTTGKTWNKDGVHVNDLGREFSLNELGDLVISNAKKKHSGKYDCKATPLEIGGVGYVTKTTDLVIIKTPVIISSSVRLSLRPGSNATFDCNVEVDPDIGSEIIVEWNKRNVTQSNILQCKHNDSQGYDSSDCLSHKEATVNEELKRLNKNVPANVTLSILKHSITLLDVDESDTSDYICLIQLPSDIPLSNPFKEKVYLKHSLVVERSTNNEYNESSNLISNESISNGRNTFDSSRKSQTELIIIVLMISFIMITIIIMFAIRLNQKAHYQAVVIEQESPATYHEDISTLNKPKLEDYTENSSYIGPYGNRQSI